MADTLVARPSDVLTDSGTVSLTAGAANALYPLTNAYDRKSYSVFKAAGATCTIRVVFGSAKTLQGLAFINCTATAIQVTNSAGLNQAVSIPATPEDGLRIDPWIDLRALANTSATTWDFAFTAASIVALGELVLAQTLRAIEITRDDPAPSAGEGHKTLRHYTDYDVALKYGMGIRGRRKRGHVKKQTYQADVLSLKRDARGGLKCFLLVWDSSANDALWVELADDHEFSLPSPSVADVELLFTEQQKGLL